MAGAMTSSSRVPGPPGTIRTSMSSGALSKVWVGTTNWPHPSAGRRLDGTGSMVEESIAMLRVLKRECVAKRSHGPKTSRDWKPGNRTTPYLVGGLLSADIMKTAGVCGEKAKCCTVECNVITRIRTSKKEGVIYLKGRGEKLCFLRGIREFQRCIRLKRGEWRLPATQGISSWDDYL